MTFRITPKVGDDRSWSRDKWKRESRMCRQFMRLMKPYIPEIERQTEEALRNLILYGTSFVRIKP